MNIQERDTEIKRLYQEGAGLTEIARRFALSNSGVWRRLKAHGVNMRVRTKSMQQITRKYVPGWPPGCGCAVCKKAGNR